MATHRRRDPPQGQRATEERRSALAEEHGIDPFVLFCSYYLGITEDGSYRFQNIHHVARRFKVNASVIRQILTDYRIDPDRVFWNAGFDMTGAQVDIMLAPDGVDRYELARPIFEELLRAPYRPRDLLKELEQDARDNERIFGPSRR